MLNDIAFERGHFEGVTNVLKLTKLVFTSICFDLTAFEHKAVLKDNIRLHFTVFKNNAAGNFGIFADRGILADEKVVRESS